MSLVTALVRSSFVRRSPAIAIFAILVAACSGQEGEGAHDGTGTQNDEIVVRAPADLTKVVFSVTSPYVSGRPTMCITPGYDALDWEQVRFVGALGQLSDVTLSGGSLLTPRRDICRGSTSDSQGKRTVVDIVLLDWSVIRATFTARWPTNAWSGPISDLDLQVERLPVGSDFEGKSELSLRCQENPYSCTR